MSKILAALALLATMAVGQPVNRTMFAASRTDSAIRDAAQQRRVVGACIGSTVVIPAALAVSYCATDDHWIDGHAALHVAGSAGVVGGLYALGRACRVSKTNSLCLAALGGLVAGVVVEVWQGASGRGDFSCKDITIDAGAILMTFCGISGALREVGK